MGDPPASAPVAGNSLFVHTVADFAMSRNGALRVLPPLSGLGDVAILHSVSESGWHHGRVHPYSGGHSLTGCSFRYWNRGTNRGFRSRGGSSFCRPTSLETCSR